MIACYSIATGSRINRFRPVQDNTDSRSIREGVLLNFDFWGRDGNSVVAVASRFELWTSTPDRFKTTRSNATTAIQPPTLTKRRFRDRSRSGAHGGDRRAGGDRCAHEPAAPVRELQVLEFSNALFSSPFASSPWRSAKVVLTSVSIVASVTVADETAATTPLIPEAPLIAFSIVVTFCCKLVASWSSESFACCPDGVSGLPSPFRSEASVCVADFVSSAAVWSPLFVGSLLRELAADLIASCQVVSDVQTPLAHASVADALVVVVELVAARAAARREERE